MFNVAIPAVIVLIVGCVLFGAFLGATDSLNHEQNEKFVSEVPTDMQQECQQGGWLDTAPITTCEDMKIWLDVVMWFWDLGWQFGNLLSGV